MVIYSNCHRMSCARSARTPEITTTRYDERTESNANLCVQCSTTRAAARMPEESIALGVNTHTQTHIQSINPKRFFPSYSMRTAPSAVPNHSHLDPVAAITTA